MRFFLWEHSLIGLGTSSTMGTYQETMPSFLEKKKLGRRIDEHRDNFNKEIENIRKYQPEITKLKNTIT